MANTFILQGHQFSIESLERSLDQEFVRLHAAFLGSSAFEWNSFVVAAHAYFDRPSVSHREHGAFFGNFTIVWRNFLAAGQFERAEQLWEMSCKVAWSWEQAHSGARIHKGTPYYFWGMTAILRGDIDRAYVLMHQALEEDVISSGQQFPDTPALAWATMNAEKVDQAAHGWVARKALLARDFLERYRTVSGKSLDFSGLNSRFLQHPPNRHTVYSLSYVLGRLVKVAEAPPNVLNSEFAAQLTMDLVFRLLQVVESSLKAKNPAGRAFLSHAVFLARQAPLSLLQADLIHVNAECNRDFANTLSRLLESKFVLPNGCPALGLARDLAVAYACRNYGAHQLLPVPDVLTHAAEIRQAVFNCLFLTVETLY